MKKANKNSNTKKVKKDKDVNLVGIEDPEDEDGEDEASPELDPEILKVISKAPKKTKPTDATDYIPELERGDFESTFSSDDDF